MPANGDGMMGSVAEELQIRFGKRDGRERAATKCMRRRATFDDAAATLKVATQPPMAGTPLQVGENVLCQGCIGELVEIRADGKCSVLFKAGNNVERRVDYLHAFGCARGSARLQRPPVYLHPEDRSQRSDAVEVEVLEHVREVYELMCPESPHQRDCMKRRLARHRIQVSCMSYVCIVLPASSM